MVLESISLDKMIPFPCIGDLLNHNEPAHLYVLIQSEINFLAHLKCHLQIHVSPRGYFSAICIRMCIHVQMYFVQYYRDMQCPWL